MTVISNLKDSFYVFFYKKEFFFKSLNMSCSYTFACMHIFYFGPKVSISLTSVSEFRNRTMNSFEIPIHFIRDVILEVGRLQFTDFKRGKEMSMCALFF